MKHQFFVLLAAMFLPMNAATAAQGVPPAKPTQPIELHGDVKLDKVVIENGQEKRMLVEPKTVVPGDKLVFSTSYRNVGTVPVDNVVVTNPLPSAVEISAQSAEALTVSVDGGKTWGLLARLTVSDGQGGTRAAATGDVTHIRWIIPVLQPGASGVVSYNGIVR